MDKIKFTLSIWKAFLIAFVDVLALPIALGIPFSIVALVSGISPEHPLIQGIVSIIAGGFLVYYFNRKYILNYRLDFKFDSRIFILFMPLVIFMLGFSIIISEFDNWFRTILPMSDYFTNLFNNLFGGSNSLIFSIITIAIIAPIIEEIVFRGLIFKGLRNKYNPIIAIVLSSFIFGVAHMNPWQFPVAFSWGIIAALLYHRTKSLIPCIVGHMLNNSMSFIFMYILKWDIPGYTRIHEGIYQPLWFDMIGLALLLLGVVLLILVIHSRYISIPPEIEEDKDDIMFRDRLGNELLIFDGALGTLIQKYSHGVKIPDELNVTNPELMKKIHLMYINAGAQVLTTNTFGANEYKLQGSGYSIDEIIKNGIMNVKEVVTNEYIALDVGPLGKMIEPLGDITFDQAYEQFKKQVIAGEKYGCDVIIIETMSDIQEARIAVLAAKENTNLPIICSMTFNENGKTMYGTDPTTMVAVMEGLGVDALGINCSYGPNKLITMVKEILKTSSIPVIVQPNAGLPIVNNGEVSYDISKDEFAKHMREMVKLGVVIVGGCCGTTPEYIKALKEITKDVNISSIKDMKLTRVTSSKKTTFIEDITIIGEALVPTGRIKYIQALEKEDSKFFYKSAKEQKKLGADIININVTTPGIDEKKAILQAVKRISYGVDIPIQIDSINPDIIEAALRNYPGIGIVNSVNGTQESMNRLFPIAKKYGALIIGMTFDEKGIPVNSKERLEIAKVIINKGKEFGIPPNKIIIDCLSLSVGGYQDYIMETLELVSNIKSLGAKSMLGITNVSYGLPNRRLLDRTYLSMALARGLDVVMMSVYDEEMISTIDAYRILANKDIGASYYKSKFGSNEEGTNVSKEGKFNITLASVKGDSINNGISILASTLKNNGFNVDLLGLNKEMEFILQNALDKGSQVIGLSSFSQKNIQYLMSTVKYIQENAPTIKIIIGGAGVKEELAKELGVYYGNNPEETSGLLKSLEV